MVARREEAGLLRGSGDLDTAPLIHQGKAHMVTLDAQMHERGQAGRASDTPGQTEGAGGAGKLSFHGSTTRESKSIMMLGLPAWTLDPELRFLRIKPPPSPAPPPPPQHSGEGLCKVSQRKHPQSLLSPRKINSHKPSSTSTSLAMNGSQVAPWPAPSFEGCGSTHTTPNRNYGCSGAGCRVRELGSMGLQFHL